MVDGILEDVVPEVKVLSVSNKVNLSVRDCDLEVLIDPFFENEELQDTSVGYISVEVGVIETISSISKSESSGISSKLFNAISHCQEVS